MEAEETLTVIKSEKSPRRERAAGGKLDRRLKKLTCTALDALEEILTDDSVKPADRISAAKLTFDMLYREAGRTEAEPPDTVKVVFEGRGADWAG